MEWSEDSAGHCRLSILSRLRVGLVFPRSLDRMYTGTSPIPADRGATRRRSRLRQGGEGFRSLANEGFATLARSAGTGGVVVSQRDDLRKDTGSEENISNLRRDGEPLLLLSDALTDAQARVASVMAYAALEVNGCDYAVIDFDTLERVMRSAA